MLKKFEVYRNLHHGCFSIRHKGLVCAHLQDDGFYYLRDVKFAVQPAGRRKVLRERRKNVHAFVRGFANDQYGEPKTCRAGYPLGAADRFNIKVTYNPYVAGHFFIAKTGEPIHEASEVCFAKGNVYIDHKSYKSR